MKRAEKEEIEEIMSKGGKENREDKNLSKFVYEIQKKKIKELWNNKKDEIWN